MASHSLTTAQRESNKTKSIKDFITIINKLLRVGFWVVKREGELGDVRKHLTLFGSLCYSFSRNI